MKTMSVGQQPAQKISPLQDRAAAGAQRNDVENNLMRFQDIVNKRRNEGNGRAAPLFNPEEKRRLKEACEGFEAMFISQMLSEMRKVTFKNDRKDSYGKDIFQEMCDQELASLVSKKGVGLGDVLFRQIAREPLEAYGPIHRDGVKLIMQSSRKGP